MPKTSKKLTGLAGLVQAALAARDRGKKAYQQSDKLMEKVLAKMKVGQEVKLSDTQSVTLVDNFAEKTTVYKPCGVRRFELAVTNT